MLNITHYQRNANQNHNEVPFSCQSELLLSKTLQAINAGEGVEKREPSYTVGGNANYYSQYGEQCGESLKKLEIELPYDPAIPLLGIHTEETRIERNMCNPVFITALFIIARSILDVHQQMNG